MKKTDNNDLAISYHIATGRISELSSNLYEDLFDPTGVTPTHNAEEIERMILEYRKMINIEFDMIRSAAKEYLDDHKPSADE